MPAHFSLAEQELEWRKTGKAAELGLSISTENGPLKMCDIARTQRDPSSDVNPTASEHKRKACAPLYIKSAQININKRNEHMAESNAVKVEERLRLARERREAYQKQLALRERGWLAREERAKQFYEKRLEERRKKLDEQRLREEMRRMAVKEKCRQRLKEEKLLDRSVMRYVMRKTMEKSQKAKQKLGHCSLQVTNNTGSKSNAQRHSLSQWEIELIIRLQTPTVSYLARSRSSVFLSRVTVVHVCHRSASCHSMNSSNTQKPQIYCGKAVNNLASSGTKATICKTTNRDLVATRDVEEKDLKIHLQSSTGIKPKVDTNPQGNAVPPPLGLQNRHVRHKTLKLDGLPPLPEEEDLEPEHELSSGSLKPDETTPQCLHRDVKQDGQLQLNLPTNGPLNPPPCSQIPNGPKRNGDEAQVRPAAWTTGPEEVIRLLAEKRRQARIQREKEDEECRQETEQVERERDRLFREDLACQRAEERAKQEAKALRLQEDMRKREDEERLQAEEVYTRRQIEENRLHQQRESHQRVMAEQQRLERERHFQIEETERQERKKRLDEIMKRTRKTDSEEKKLVSVKRNFPCENEKPIIRIPNPGKTPKLELRDEEDMLPEVAFKERRSFRTLSGLEEIQAHQQTGKKCWLSHVPAGET
ncbi:ensconsin-like [Myxocyprinus asiaticus]|uniref:ensconsin-like n=1 Tax=Myxocyprinus asiaticus TaxID=70543 RepID=UPI002221D5FF|nr:ensconsin-like [Myxocyprinus asiaticus]